MAQQLSIEDASRAFLITTRTAGSNLWFINNLALEERILGCLARYQNIYGVTIYAFVLMGNHYHLVAQFPKMNRAQFMRDFNSAVARLVGRSLHIHGRRSVWARRYAHQMLPRANDVKNWFYYSALNPVSSGITRTVQEYCSYNSFEDSANGIVRTYKYVEWTKYQDKLRHNPETRIGDFTIEYPLVYSRLPGCENESAGEYAKALKNELLDRQGIAIFKRISEGKGFLGAERVKKTPIGAKPKTTKSSTRKSKRPIILTLCDDTREVEVGKYFVKLRQYKQISKAYRSGDFTVVFPFGTYPPGLGLGVVATIDEIQIKT